MLLEPLAFLLGRLLEQLCARLERARFGNPGIAAAFGIGEWHGTLKNRMMVGRVSPLRPAHTRLFQRTLRLPVPLLDRQDFSQAVATGFESESSGRSHRQNSFVGRTGAAARGAGRTFSSSLAGTGKTRTHAGANCGHCRRRQSRLAATSGHASSRRISHAALRARLIAAETTSHRKLDRQRRRLHAVSRSADRNCSAHLPSTAARYGALCAMASLAHVHCPKRKEMQGEILWTAGPWRSSGDWWEQEGWSRDEWDIAVQAESGIALYRLVRDLLERQVDCGRNYD